MSKNELIFGDLFGGAGGLSVGFKMANFESCFFNELNQTAAATHALNFPGSKAFIGPIQELSAKEIRTRSGLAGSALDVMVGGPPCQGFSINAPIRSRQDPRNSLFHHYARLVLEGLRPKIILMENVPGLISLDAGQTLESVKSAFERAGYQIILKVLNAAHYGVPEERWRLFFLGTRLDGLQLSFPEPTHHSFDRPNFTGGRDYTFRHAIGRGNGDLFYPLLKSPTCIEEAISDLPKIKPKDSRQEMAYPCEPRSEYQAILRKGSPAIYNHVCAALSEINLDRLKHVRPGGSWRDIPHKLLPAGLQRARRSDHTKRYGRLDPQGLSGTIMTKCDPHWGTFIHYNQDRVISVREAARIQSFPDWFRFTGSKTEQYRDVGNAVPPLLAKALAEHIKKLLASTPEKRSSKKTFSYAAR